MTFEEYQELAARTMPQGRTPQEDLSMTSLGLVGEIGELVEHVKKCLYHGASFSDRRDAMEKEIGDVLWYIAGVSTTLNARLAHGDIEDIAEFQKAWIYSMSVDGAALLLAHRASLIGHRVAFVNHWPLMPTDRQEFIGRLSYILHALSSMSTKLGISLNEAAARNIEKLRTRYPDGFEEKEHDGQ